MTDLLSEDELAGLKALADAATPGPWLTPADDIWDMLADGSPGIPLFRRATSHDRRWGRPYEQDEQIANAAFIAGFNPQTALRLLSHIDALKAERDGLKEECAKLAEAVQFPEASKCLPTPRRGFELAQMKIAAAIRAKGQL